MNSNFVVGFVSTALIATSLFAPLLVSGKEEKKKAVTGVELQTVHVKKVKGKDNLFTITASGTVPTYGWKVKLKPVTYIQEPDDWRIEVSAERPTGMVAQMITPWETSIEMGLGPKTQKITVANGDQLISKNVPH